MICFQSQFAAGASLSAFVMICTHFHSLEKLHTLFVLQKYSHMIWCTLFWLQNDYGTLIQLWRLYLGSIKDKCAPMRHMARKTTILYGAWIFMTQEAPTSCLQQIKLEPGLIVYWEQVWDVATPMPAGLGGPFDLITSSHGLSRSTDISATLLNLHAALADGVPSDVVLICPSSSLPCFLTVSSMWFGLS
jgi:hypothetical protein